ncbi:MAG: hypothetical protein MUW56_02585 [Chryseobacterium sp.]|uniref:hypothetical protein n=1 Tax=Chryseobacterium sp. TaxID=1871047 RepID=UPI0025C6094C|nr:hypothetical protein [Chryseobacterium sp.]MCJ7932534.1 hypothetical protein [Chryseobacterium sp.]
MNIASYEPTKGDYLIYSKDTGGNEFGQLYKLDLKTLESQLLTDGEELKMGELYGKKTVPVFILLRRKEMAETGIFII